MSWSNKWGDDKLNASGGHKDAPEWNEKTGWKDLGNGVQEMEGFKQLTLYNGNKQYTFTAEIIGDLALDFTPEGQPNAGWNIYHVPTLSCFSKAVPGFIKHHEECISSDYTNFNKCTTIGLCEENCYEYSREALLTWMAKVQKNYPTSWTMLRLLTPDNYSDSGQSAKDIILKWCLSVPVVEE